MVTTPLWVQFAKMTQEQAEAEQAIELARLAAGDMSVAEANARAEAWRMAGEYQLREADALSRWGGGNE